jgi:hypothetical protein
LCLFRLCPGAASRLWTCHSEKPQMKVLIQSQQARFRKGLGLAQTSTAGGNWATGGGNRGLAEMPIVPERPLCAARAHDQAHERAGDRALSLDASGRGAVRPRGLSGNEAWQER